MICHLSAQQWLSQALNTTVRNVIVFEEYLIGNFKFKSFSKPIEVNYLFIRVYKDKPRNP